MVNEATLIIQTMPAIGMTCSNSTGIEKGALLKLSDPFTVALSTGQNDQVGGIAMGEKIANDGKTKIPVARAGIFKVTLSGACTVGDAVCLQLGNYNQVYAPASFASGAVILGTALETGATGETILVELNPHAARGKQ